MPSRASESAMSEDSLLIDSNRSSVVEEETDDEEDEDDVKIVLHQEEWENEHVQADDVPAPDSIANEDAALESEPANDCPTAASSTAESASGVVTKGAANAHAAAGCRCSPATPHKKYVNPNLGGSNSMRATGSAVSRLGSGSARTPTSRQAAAHRARLGPLQHVPGGLEMDPSGPLPDNVDIDSVQDKGWRVPGADITDYFNYGFTEDTWRLYSQRQQEMRLEQQMQSKIKVFEGSRPDQADLPEELRAVQTYEQSGAQPQQPTQWQLQQLQQLQQQLQQRIEQQEQQQMEPVNAEQTGDQQGNADVREKSPRSSAAENGMCTSGEGCRDTNSVCSCDPSTQLCRGEPNSYAPFLDGPMCGTSINGMQGSFNHRPAWQGAMEPNNMPWDGRGMGNPMDMRFHAAAEVMPSMGMMNSQHRAWHGAVGTSGVVSGTSPGPGGCAGASSGTSSGYGGAWLDHEPYQPAKRQNVNGEAAYPDVYDDGW
eukprot:CAMPEP_0119333288 /NCGR_PEP_ID=MMETSP1333-20130426/84807_1 /TAXON_ID=418940 /ORGANISM="Scyphosphaera apsteinii, Strain RCC1455" /LENGTH=484 /DNA_ID=CAMNT_0007343323 /DNA_START=6 /DNA_END=1460 /DNA_ORIENTATION=+